MSEHNKLVRDGIPALLARRGVRSETRRLSGERLVTALRAKVDEELAEYDAAAADDDALNELADVLEVVYALAASRGGEARELDERRARKARERGTFRQGIELLRTG